jgi:hypothetical protein
MQLTTKQATQKNSIDNKTSHLKTSHPKNAIDNKTSHLKTQSITIEKSN